MKSDETHEWILNKGATITGSCGCVITITERAILAAVIEKAVLGHPSECPKAVSEP